MGVLGGMGPEASAEFLNLSIRISQTKYKAVQDTDYTPTVLLSIPFEDFDETGIRDIDSVLKQLKKRVATLNKIDSDFIVIPCNTAHCFIEELRKYSKVPVLSIIEETAKRIVCDNISTVGLLASETTYAMKMYDNALQKEGIKVILPDDTGKKNITQLILEVMSGKVTTRTKRNTLSLIERMQDKSADGIILGCTEIPIAIKPQDVNIKLYDTLEILAESALEYSRK